MERKLGYDTLGYKNVDETLDVVRYYCFYQNRKYIKGGIVNKMKELNGYLGYYFFVTARAIKPRIPTIKKTSNKSFSKYIYRDLLLLLSPGQP